MSARILIVDDDVTLRLLVRQVLSVHGFTVLEAGSGQQAHDLMANKPDLVIVDGLLPDGDGIQWITQLRERDREVKIVFLSAFWRDVPTFQRLTRELGVGLVLHKPIVPEAFAEQIARQLGQFQRGAPPEPPSWPADDPLSALRSEFRSALPERLAGVHEALRAAQGGAASPIRTARALAHKLRGTAGSFGFVEAGAVCGRVEDALAKLIDTDTAPSTELVSELSRLLDEIRTQLLLSPEPERRSWSSVASATVLVVDDDPTFRRQAERCARGQLVDVVLAASANEAIEQLRAGRRIDAVLVSAQLPPEGAASAVASELRGLPTPPPFAFLSRDGTQSHRVAAAHAGARLFLEKPLDPDTLEAAVRDLIACTHAAQPHVFVVDDDAAFRGYLTAVLEREGMRVTGMADADAMLEAMAGAPPDVLLLDMIMPGIGGIDVCRLLRTSREWQEIPILFLTASANLESRIAAYRAGADDYLVKPLVEDELLARVNVRLERARLLRERAEKDALTGLLLRRAFLERARARMAEARRRDHRLTLCLLDVDHFKIINDSQGHLVGDRVLATLGSLLCERFRAEDLRGRWGGEEFILAFPGERGEAIERVLARALKEVAALEFTGEGGEHFRVTLSAGISSYPEDGGSLEALLQAADRRVYAAKQQGRNRVVFEG
jgi:diguanylate cyclase (GGDEF)-like protein